MGAQEAFERIAELRADNALALLPAVNTVLDKMTAVAAQGSAEQVAAEDEMA